MNKTININLGGIFFHIDETAYNKLKRYLDAIRRSLSDDPQGRDEIITDIEARISELLSERVKDARQVVSESDIDEVIAVMGQPEDYMVDEELFTDESGKSYTSKSTSKKLFRDGEDKFLGGVSSGMAHYLGVDVIWIRLAWLILAFGTGFGFILYPVLWILLPEAKTTAEKLQMEGEPVNITNIERKIRQEFEEASERVKGAAGDVKDAVKEGYDSLKKKDLKRSSDRAKSGLQEIIETLGRVIGFIFKVIGKFIGIILILVSIGLLIALIVSFFTAGTVDFLGLDTLFHGDVQVMNPTGSPLWLISLIVLTLAGIPLLMLFSLGIFILSSKAKVLGRTAKFVLLGIWLIALLAGIYITLSTLSEYSKEGTFIQKSPITAAPLSDTLRIKMVTDDKLFDEVQNYSHVTFKKIIGADDKASYYSNNVNFYIRKSDSSSYIRTVRNASGSTRLAAKKNAEEIQYKYEQSGDNLLLDSYFLVDEKTPYRSQDVNVTLYIPVNQIIFIDESTQSFLRYARNIHDIYNYEMMGHYFKMTDAGLDCLDCDPSIYRDQPDNDNEVEKDTVTKDGVNVKIDENGLKVKIHDDGEQAELRIDENGVKIK